MFIRNNVTTLYGIGYNDYDYTINMLLHAYKIDVTGQIIHNHCKITLVKSWIWPVTYISSPYLTGGRINLPYLNLFSIIRGTVEAVAELSDIIAIVCGYTVCWLTLELSSLSSYQCEMFAGICSYDFFKWCLFLRIIPSVAWMVYDCDVKWCLPLQLAFKSCCAWIALHHLILKHVIILQFYYNRTFASSVHYVTFASLPCCMSVPMERETSVRQIAIFCPLIAVLGIHVS